MNLFSDNIDKSLNILPKDGEVLYYGAIFSTEKQKHFFDTLLQEIFWEHDEVFIFGKKIITKRKVAWYGDSEFLYTYSKNTKKALIWTPALLVLKKEVEKVSKESYNTCLLNLYHSGEEGMGWHSDDEKEMKKNGAIASLSFGETRKFKFRHKEDKSLKIDISLEGGSLLVMKGVCQEFWQHQLPITKKVSTPRINLTFRTISE